ncbi:MAG: cyclic nucleotide-binding domain-containing protein [Pseudomonadota bacterium]
MIIQEAIEYLQVTPPFQDLEEPILRDISGSLSIETYPRGTTIISSDGLAQQAYRVIHKGSVKVFIRRDKNEEALVEYLGEGDSFGYPSQFGGDVSRIQVVAMEDTTCYLIGRDTILNLFKSHPRFAEHFFLSCQKKTIDRPYRELKKSKLMYGGGDRLLFSTPIGQLVTRELITASEDISIREASALMTKNGSDSLILINAVGLPTGIITDKDLRDRVVTKDRDVKQPASSIQSISLVKAEANETCIEALYKMVLYNIHHLLVLNNGSLKGVITSHWKNISPYRSEQRVEPESPYVGFF